MKLLYVTSLSGKRINGFMRSAIVAAKMAGLEFIMACNMDMADKEGYLEDCEKYGIETVHIDFDRNPIKRNNIKAYKQLNQIISESEIDIVHCNTPIGGVLGRLCAKKNKIPYVIYQAHGFHFWKGAPKLNWMLYYPIEKYLAHFSNMIITINQEDYDIATRMRLKKNGIVKLVHGVGIDTARFQKSLYKKGIVRNELEIPEDATVFVTVGELNKNKNHKLLINSFYEARIKNSYLLICGEGEKRKELEEILNERKISNIILLGFRNDIAQILSESDIFILPSLREGLPGALMEAMAIGLPCIVSNIRGNRDLVGKHYKYLFDPRDRKSLTEQLVSIISEKENYGLFCKKAVEPYQFEKVVLELKEIYEYAEKKVRETKVILQKNE